LTAAGVPLAVVAALNHAGVEIDFMEFAAASGWSFSFAYRYDDISPAFMAVRSRPESDAPLEVFAFLPGHLGFGYDIALTRDADALWGFVEKHYDAGTPLMSEHLDGGLITGYREADGRRRPYFDATVMPGWIDVGDLNPCALYVPVKPWDALPREQRTLLSLKRVVFKGSAHEWQGTRQGSAALRAYLADVCDPAGTLRRPGRDSAGRRSSASWPGDAARSGCDPPRNNWPAKRAIGRSPPRATTSGRSTTTSDTARRSPRANRRLGLCGSGPVRRSASPRSPRSWSRPSPPSATAWRRWSGPSPPWIDR